jgi:hypothetical protein
MISNHRGFDSKWLAPITVLALVLSGGVVSAQPHGEIVAWGFNVVGQTTVPEPNINFVAVAAGGNHSLGLLWNGSIVAWGYDDHGRTDVPLPNINFVAVAAGDAHSLGLKRDGSIVAWGVDNDGRLNVPAPNSGFVGLAAGAEHSLGLKADRSIVAWGDNTWGQLNVPAPNGGFVAVSAGWFYNLGLRADGSIVGWGQNDWGQANAPSPNTGFIAVAAGGAHSLALKADGSIVAWGHYAYGQLNVPEPNTGFVAVAAGSYFSYGLKADGSIVAWGDNGRGQLDLPTPNSDFVAIAAGGSHGLGLKAAGLPLPVALQRFDARWNNDRVVVAWQLIDIEGALSFEVSRGSDRDAFVRLNDVAIRSDGSGAFHFEDGATDPGRTYTYHVTVFENGDAITSFETSLTTPRVQLALGPNHPNPFNPATRIPFVIDVSQPVTLAVYDVAGHRVRTLVDQTISAGHHFADWDGRDGNGRTVTSGVYFVRLEAGRVLSHRMVLLK